MTGPHAAAESAALAIAAARLRAPVAPWELAAPVAADDDRELVEAALARAADGLTEIGSGGVGVGADDRC